MGSIKLEGKFNDKKGNRAGRFLKTKRGQKYAKVEQAFIKKREALILAFDTRENALNRYGFKKIKPLDYYRDLRERIDDRYGMLRTEPRTGTSQMVIPSKSGLKKFGSSTFFEAIERNMNGRKFTIYLPLSKYAAYQNMGEILLAEDARRARKYAAARDAFKASRKGAMGAGVLGGIHQLRQRLSVNMKVAIRRAMYQAQEELLARLNEAVGWKNLTGNAYKGLVSLMYFQFGDGSERKMRSVAQAAGKRRLATRSKINPGSYRHGRSTSNRYERKEKVFYGRRYDNPSEWFAIKDRGQFVPTSGKYSYNDARNMLNLAEQSRSSVRGSQAALMLASGAEYANLLSTGSGMAIMEYANKLMNDLVSRYIRQYIRSV